MLAPEKKVTAATGAAAATGLVLWLLSTYVFDGLVPEAVADAVVWVVTAAAAFVGGYIAKHTPRIDPEAAQAQLHSVSVQDLLDRENGA